MLTLLISFSIDLSQFFTSYLNFFYFYIIKTKKIKIFIFISFFTFFILKKSNFYKIKPKFKKGNLKKEQKFKLKNFIKQ